MRNDFATLVKILNELHNRIGHLKPFDFHFAVIIGKLYIRDGAKE